MEDSKTFVKEAFKFGWDSFLANIGFFAYLFALLLFFSIGQSYVQSAAGTSQPLQFILQTVFFIFNVVVSMGMIRISLVLADGKKASFMDLFAPSHLFWKYLFAGILYGLAVAAGIILLIIPGIIWGIRYLLFDYFVIDRESSPVDAMKLSATATKDMFWPLSWFMSIAILINIAGALMLGIGLFVSVPVTMIAEAHIYRKLAK